MAYRTIRERVALYLVAMGKQQVLSSSKRYDKYQSEDSAVCYFLGKHGAVRLSSDGKLKGSFDIRHSILKRVEEWEQSYQGYVYDKEIGF